MKKFGLMLILLLLVTGFSASTTQAQCICSEVRMLLVDEQGKPLDEKEVTVKELNAVRPAARIGIGYDGEKRLNVVFHIGWGRGDEVLAITHKGAEMRIHFKFKEEFGKPRGTIIFRKGDFVAEPYEECDDAPDGIKLSRLEKN